MQPAEMFQTLGQYNRWANNRLYDAVAALGDGEIRAERQAFFGSILATLNHGLVGDRLWISRVVGTPEQIPLDHLLYPDFGELRKAREAMDSRIISVVADLSGERLAENLDYKTVAGEACSTPLTLVLMHMFNHQTHHRGQVHDMLSQTPCSPPPLDIIYFHREMKAG